MKASKIEITAYLKYHQIIHSHWTVKEYLLVINKDKQFLIDHLNLKEPFNDQTLLKDLK